jgi:hypothetical protein
MKWMLILTLASVLLGGCGGTAATVDGGSASAPSTATTPEQVHRAWVDAIRNNNRAVLLLLTAEMDFKTSFVDDNLRSVQDHLRGTVDGTLQSIDVRPVTDDSVGKLGVSVWRFAKRPICYGTFMAVSDGVWKVIRWGIVPQQCKGIT